MFNDRPSKWMIELNDNLQMKQNIYIKIFLISKKRFDKYMQEVFNTNNTNNNLIKNNNNYDLNNNILKNELFNDKNIIIRLVQDLSRGGL